MLESEALLDIIGLIMDNISFTKIKQKQEWLFHSFKVELRTSAN